ncbi:hypothetical protein IEO21_03745 [Rhodonia placenta]|uniref:Cytochrome P450 n=1 Tax=Rhodonia placenta TaxID=104341 RepID=A0A8H7P577_9APHY|nr:hypothetical protein IEO21_03745 [Postia placenta]
MPKNTSSEMLDYTFGLVCLIFLILGFVTTRRRSRYPLPPGPPGSLIVGNAFQIPRTHSWITYSRLAEQYGKGALSMQIALLSLWPEKCMTFYIYFSTFILKSSQRRFVVAVVLQITHGRAVYDCQDPFVKIAEDVSNDFSELIKPGRFLVDSFPILRFTPGWFPGVQYKKIAKKVQERLHQAYDVPYSQIKEQMEFGTASPSAIVSWIEEHPNATPEEENMAKLAIGVFYTAVILQTVSALESLFLILAMYPDVQRKAQAEIDTLIGSDRLPNFNDRHPIPHSVMEDDVYMGYYIPAGATVIANSWAVLHDPYLYPDPFEVKPERYLQSGEGINPDPRAFAFGYGRRVCPGQPLAEDSLYIVAATVLATMNIDKAVGPDGLVLEPVVEYTGDLIRLALALSHPDT